MSLGTLVLGLADCKQLLGLRYAEWATRAPTLEADIAAAAMGLDDLGHSRVLYGCLEALGDDPRGPERHSDPASYLVVPMLDRPWTRWGEFVAANAVLDTAFTAMIGAMVEGSVDVLRSRLHKMLVEERFHFLHGRSWLAESADDAALLEAWTQVVEWFGPPDGDVAALHRTGLLGMGPQALLRQVGERLGRPVPPVQVDWNAWDARRRRSRPGELDAPTFAMLRGLEEGRFMPAGTARQA